DMDAYRKAMPQADELKARFGSDVMATEIEKAYFAALSK
ncbi:MAG: glycosyltransferase family 1 protein, partial [Mesorhizobium sp.]